MFRRGNIIIFIVNAAIFIALEIAALAMLRNNGQLQNLWISKGAHGFMAGVWGCTEDIRHYFSLKKENEDLAGMVFRQAQALRLYREQTGRDIPSDTTFDTVGNFRYIPASVSKTTRNSQHNYIIIDKGSDDGVSPGSGIITDKGVVGIVDAVSRNYSYGRSFRNSDMVISARIGLTGTVGALSWDGIHSNGAVLREIPLHIRLNEGDTVYTSGFSSLFPPDIPLGTTGEYVVENGATYEVKIRLFEDFSSVRYVTVVSNTDREEITELENR